jgi:hypothetical protein
MKLEDLDGLKLVEDRNFAPESEVLETLEAAYMQGSQGWGVTRPTAEILYLARALRGAMTVAATAEENYRLLKGAQMEVGRLKKQRDKLEETIKVLRDEVDALTARVSELEVDSADN